jgi:hypothetical protein
MRVSGGILLVSNRSIVLISNCLHGTRDARCPSDHGVHESSDDDGKQHEMSTTDTQETVVTWA